jgi:hypothetical protein
MVLHNEECGMKKVLVAVDGSDKSLEAAALFGMYCPKAVCLTTGHVMFSTFEFLYLILYR